MGDSTLEVLYDRARAGHDPEDWHFLALEIGRAGRAPAGMGEADAAAALLEAAARVPYGRGVLELAALALGCPVGSCAEDPEVPWIVEPVLALPLVPVLPPSPLPVLAAVRRPLVAAEIEVLLGDDGDGDTESWEGELDHDTALRLCAEWTTRARAAGLHPGWVFDLPEPIERGALPLACRSMDLGATPGRLAVVLRQRPLP